MSSAEQQLSQPCTVAVLCAVRRWYLVSEPQAASAKDMFGMSACRLVEATMSAEGRRLWISFLVCCRYPDGNV